MKLLQSIADILKSPVLGGLPGLAVLVVTIYGVASWVINTDAQFDAIDTSLEQIGKSLEELQNRYLAEGPRIAPEAAAVPVGNSRPSAIPPGTSASAPSDAPVLEKFAVARRVRCPGGGDWLGKERNRRSGYAEFKAPKDAWILQGGGHGPRVEVLAQNDGSYGSPEFREPDAEGRPTEIRVALACDPPNYPGAGGGWMEIELSGTFQRAAIP